MVGGIARRNNPEDFSKYNKKVIGLCNINTLHYI